MRSNLTKLTFTLSIINLLLHELTSILLNINSLSNETLSALVVM